MTSASTSHAFLKPRRAMLIASTFLSYGIATPAIAQLSARGPVPERETVDGNGVDLSRGTVSLTLVNLSIGTESEGAAFQIQARNSYAGFSPNGFIQINGTSFKITLNDTSEEFTLTSNGWVPKEQNGNKLEYGVDPIGFSSYDYTLKDGTVAHFVSFAFTNTLPLQLETMLTYIKRPDGTVLNINYRDGTQLVGTTSTGPILQYDKRVQSLTTNTGYHIHLTYGSDDDSAHPNDWKRLTKIVGFNATAISCLPTVGDCGNDAGWPSIKTTSSGTTWTLTDSLNRATAVTFAGPLWQISSIRHPGLASDDWSATYNTDNRVSQIVNRGVTTTYSYADASNIRTTTITGAAGRSRIVRFNLATMQPIDDTIVMSPGANRTISYSYDTSARLTRKTFPEGNYEQYSYDLRGNISETRLVSKTPGTPADIVVSSTYASTCSNALTCNKPASTTDAKGKITEFTYDPDHGGVRTVTMPAASSGGIRPQITSNYTPLQGYYYNGSGSITASGQPIYKLSSTSTCMTSASCVGATEEIKTTMSYGPQTTGIGNNLQLVSTTTGAGDASVSSTTAITYDLTGNVASVDGPLSGNSDTTTYRYDAARQQVGMISPDPDGGGALKRRALRYTYNGEGQVTLAEQGTVNGTTDTEWSAFVPLQQVGSAYDTNGRKISDTAAAGGTIYAMRQYSYDVAGRPDCAALRMNMAVFGSLSSSACTLGTTGSAGPDRIIRYSYNVADELTVVTSAYGTADQTNNVTTSYTNNGRTATQSDGVGNKTSYEYDGFDRLVKTFYPNTAAGSGVSSTTDYQQLIYDENSNIKSRRLRGYASDSTLHIDYTYDNLNRLTLKNTPDSGVDINYSYDLLGHPTIVSGSGQTLYFTYDALGRRRTESGPVGTVASQYDAAGRRTSLTWPDGFYVNYDYLVTGETTTIRENGATSGAAVLATYSYDDLGRRTALTRGNGTTTIYGFDNVSRLTSLGHDLSGTNYDLSLSFSHNPAGQIVEATRSNDVYAWASGANTNKAYTTNGLNQPTAIDTATLSYDVRGNLTNVTKPGISNNYYYSAENLLRVGPSSNALYYDPLLRLFQVNDTNRFGYDDQSMIGEYTSANVLTKRYVYGPRMDEPLVWYEGSGTSDRRWLHADERGSIIAVTNSSGAALAVNSYNEYGIPAAGNVGRFQYTGQAYLPEFGLYYYKARIYYPDLGRFMQTDPIGYGDGMNWYNYAHGDPINGSDPTGLADIPDIVVVGTRDSPGMAGVEHPYIDQFAYLWAPPVYFGPKKPAAQARETGSKRYQQKASQCYSGNYNIEGDIDAFGAGGSAAQFHGKLTNVETGESYEFESKDWLTPGAGIGIGSYGVSGTVKAVITTDINISISFATVGYSKFSLGRASITGTHTNQTDTQSLGNITIDAGLSAIFRGVGGGAFISGWSGLKFTGKKPPKMCGGK